MKNLYIFIISSNISCCRHDIAEKFLIGGKQQSITQCLKNIDTTKYMCSIK